MANKKNKIVKEDGKLFAVPRENILFIIIGFAVMVLGYVLMCGGGSKELDEFNYGMFSFRRITLAPLVILIGMVIEIVAIMHVGKRNRE